MDRVRIYSGGTGKLQHDTRGTSATSETNQTLSDEFNAGVNFVVDGEEGEVHCYFNASRNAPEQFMALYNGSRSTRGPELLQNCKQAIENAVEEQGWSLLDENRGQEWLLALGDGEYEWYDDEVGKRMKKVERARPMEFEAPSPAAGVHFARKLLKENDRRRIAVGHNDPTRVCDKLNVSVTVNESANRIQLAGETLQRVQKHELKNLKDDLNKSIEGMFDRQPGSQVANELNSLATGRLGVSFTYSPNRTTARNRRFVGYGLAGFGLTVLAGLAVAYLLGWTDRVFDLLTTSYSLRDLGLAILPGPRVRPLTTISAAPIPSWSVLLATGVVAVILTSGRVTNILGKAISALSSGRQRHRRRTSDIGSTLSEIHSHPLVNHQGGFIRQLNSVLKQYNIRVTEAESTERTRRKHQFGGLLTGILIGALVGMLFYFSSRFVEQHWQLFITVSYIVLFASVLYLLLFAVWKGIRRLLGSPQQGSTTMHGRSGRRSSEENSYQLPRSKGRGRSKGRPRRTRRSKKSKSIGRYLLVILAIVLLLFIALAVFITEVVL